MLIGEGQCDRRLRSGGRGSSAPHRRQQHVRRRVVTERLAHVREADDVARGEDEAAAELKRILAEALLPMPGLPRARPGRYVVAAEAVQQRRVAQAGGAVRAALLVDQEGKRDCRLLTEGTRVPPVAEPD